MVARIDPRVLAEVLTLHDKVRRSYSRNLKWQLTCVAYTINPEVFAVPQIRREPPMAHKLNMRYMAVRLAKLLHMPLPDSGDLHEIGKLLLAVETHLLHLPNAETEEIDFV
jgi:hypothetical protein